MYNQGDTITLILDYTVDSVPLVDYNPDEIEFSLGEKQYTMSGNAISIDSVSGKYAVNIGQADSFELEGSTKYQIRIKKSGQVISSKEKRMVIGDSISRVVL